MRRVSRNTGSRAFLFGSASLIWAAIVVTPSACAAEKTIEAKAPMKWEPTPLSASVGDVIEWKLSAGEHGVRITNWSGVKNHVEVESVAGQHLFNTTTGQNDSTTATAGLLLLRLKIKSVPQPPAKIMYECIADRSRMAGEVSVEEAATSRTAGADTDLADAFRNITLTTHDNKTVKVYDDLIKNKIVIINVMYTRCDGKCKPGINRLVQLQKYLGDSLGRTVFMYSITLEPTHDTPKVLKDYAAAHRAKPGWTFLTGDLKDITTVRRRLGLSNPDLEKDADRTRHTGAIVIGNDAFREWTMMSINESPDKIWQDIDRIMSPAQREK